MMKRDIRIEQVLPFSREQVWHALTDQQMLGAWFMPNDFQPVQGYEFTFRMKPQRGWDGITHCQVIDLQPLKTVAYTYRGKASGEKPLACAGINSEVADKALKGVFAELDTVLRFTLTSDPSSDGTEKTRLLLEQIGYKGFKLVIVSFIMGMGWHKILRRLSALLESQTTGKEPIPGSVHA